MYCPESHSYAYLSGKYCCESQLENDNSAVEGEVCDGGQISLSSVCCRGHKYLRCPGGKDCRSLTCTGNISVAIIRTIPNFTTTLLLVTFVSFL